MKPQGPKTNIYLYQSTFRGESRILKETNSLVQAGLVEQCLILAMWEPGFPEYEKIDRHRTLKRLRTPFGFLRKLRWARFIVLSSWLVIALREINRHQA